MLKDCGDEIWLSLLSFHGTFQKKWMTSSRGKIFAVDSKNKRCENHLHMQLYVEVKYSETVEYTELPTAFRITINGDENTTRITRHCPAQDDEMYIDCLSSFCIVQTVLKSGVIDCNGIEDTKIEVKAIESPSELTLYNLQQQSKYLENVIRKYKRKREL